MHAVELKSSGCLHPSHSQSLTPPPPNLSPLPLPGTVVSAPRGSYIILPLEEVGVTSKVERGAHLVTMIWLVGCT